MKHLTASFTSLDFILFQLLAQRLFSMEPHGAPALLRLGAHVTTKASPCDAPPKHTTVMIEIGNLRHVAMARVITLYVAAQKTNSKLKKSMVKCSLVKATQRWHVLQ